MVITLLTRAGYTVIGARDGNEGKTKCVGHKPNLVITDIIMPGKEGLELITDIKKVLPDIKIIAISGGGRLGPENYLPQANSLGADCSFTKPLVNNNLLEAVDVLCNSIN